MNLKERKRFLIDKTVSVLITLLLVTLFSFLLMRFSPIDPATAYVKRNSAMVTQEQIDAAKIRFGYDKPLYIQYLSWLENAVHLNFGTSLSTGHSVLSELKNSLPTTLIIVMISVASTIIGVLIFGCLGYMSHHCWLRKLLQFIGILGVSVPAFYIATAFIDVFAIKVGTISVVGNSGFSRYGPAALCLCISGICFYSQMLTDALIHEMDQDYCIYAKCRGLSETRILLLHALPHAMIDLLPSFAQMLGMSLANAAIVERVFSLSGFGYLIIDSVIARDAPVIHAAVLILAGALVIMDVIAEVVQKLLKREL